MQTYSYEPVLATQITVVAEDSPAQAAGLEAGDLVYSVNDTTITLDSSLSDVILAKRRRGSGD